ncbi:MAG: DUF4040 domain-containing protein [Pseudomonadota bacterium]
MRDLFAAAMLFAIYSLLSAALFVLLDAGDVALTEAAVGAGISTILVLAVLTLTRRYEHSVHRVNWPALAVVSVTGLCLLWAVSDLPDFGDPNNPVHTHLAPYFINNVYSDMGIPNMVAAVLASYRSVDTFGEVIVIFVAGLAVYTLLSVPPPRRPRRKENDAKREEPPA